MEPLKTLFEIPDLPNHVLPDPLRDAYGGDLGFGQGDIYANFVTSLDGVAALDRETPPSIISGKNEADRFVMGLLRAFAEAIVVGAGTLRAEPKHLWTPEYIYPPFKEAYTELRRSLGLEGQPLLVVVTRRGDIDPALPAFEREAVVVTTGSAASRLRASLPGSARVVTLEEERDSILQVLDALHTQGVGTVLTEGGPTVFGGFLKARVLNELFLTLSPRLAGRMPGNERLGVVEHFAYGAHELLPLTLRSAKQSGSHLFLRYRVDRNPRP
jgi:riboflavin biosynthesis pyrimidine reductase